MRSEVIMLKRDSSGAVPEERAASRKWMKRGKFDLGLPEAARRIGGFEEPAPFGNQTCPPGRYGSAVLAVICPADARRTDQSAGRRHRIRIAGPHSHAQTSN